MTSRSDLNPAQVSIGGAQRFEALDGWRGIAALVIALYHFQAYSHLWEAALLRNAWLFVDLFFMVSGFVISHAYLHRLAGSASLLRFAASRLGRLWPLHAVMLVVLIATEFGRAALHAPGIAFSEGRSVFAIATNLLLLQGLGLHPSLTWNAPSWSLSAAFWISMGFAVLARATKGAWPAFALVVVAALAGLAALSPGFLQTNHDFGFLRGVYGFGAGHFAWRAAQVLQQRGAAERLGAELSTAAELLGTAAVLGFMVYTRSGEAHSLAAPLIFGPAVVVFSWQRGALSRWLASAALRWLGRMSYAVYLVHLWPCWLLTMACGGVAERFLGQRLTTYVAGAEWIGTSRLQGDALTALYLLIVLGLAALAHHAVEIPARRLSRNWVNRIGSATPRSLPTTDLRASEL